MCSGVKASSSAFIANLRRPMPMAEKLRLVSRNTWIKISRRQGCCGHHCEPGC